VYSSQFLLLGVEFVIANTDAQALKRSKTHHKVQLGKGLTKGLGAGSSPATGRAAAEESIKEIMDIIGDSQMVFLTAGSTPVLILFFPSHLTYVSSLY
jgi:cell division protein FtsZ